MYPTRERRIHRSSSKALALQYFLKASALRLGVKSMVLGCRDGLVVSSVGEGVDPETAAAYAPLMFHEQVGFPETLAEPYFIEAIPLAGHTLYLFVVGTVDPKAFAKNGTSTGLRRIWNEA